MRGCSMDRAPVQGGAQRAAELAIINSVQEGLASKLDYEAIIRCLLAERSWKSSRPIRRISGFWTQLNSNSTSHSMWYAARGLDINTGTLPLGQGLTSVVFTSPRAPARRHNGECNVEAGGTRAAYGRTNAGPQRDLPGSANSAGKKRALGVVSVQRYRQHAYTQDQVGLLQTLVSSMSVALENARLFDETQRLLKETDQRARGALDYQRGAGGSGLQAGDAGNI